MLLDITETESSAIRFVTSHLQTRHLHAIGLLGTLMIGCASHPHCYSPSACDPVTESAGPQERFDSADADSSIRPASYYSENLVQPTQADGEAQPQDPDKPKSGKETPQETPSERLPAPQVPDYESGEIQLSDVVQSIHASFPLMRAANQERQIALGKQIAAWGNFDTKLKAGTENGPLGFYETYRHYGGLISPTYQGGQLFAGYRIGRGSFQPWFLERQTNDGGEFKAGFRMPLIRNRNIDARRAELWRATYDVQRAEPEIRTQLIFFVREGSIAYWEWVASGRKVQIGIGALELAKQRNAQINRKIEVGQEDPPVLQDNLRAVAKREAKLIDLKRKLQQSSLKLSIFLRDGEGSPQVPLDAQLVDFPTPQAIKTAIEDDIAAAIAERPEITVLDTLAQRVNVDLAEARNEMLPAVDAQLIGSQDAGEPTSKKRDKSQFELEAGIFVDVPIQRRKGLGKSRAAQAKLIQLRAKRQFTEDKIGVEVRAVYAALKAAYDRLDRARESKRLADYMVNVEKRKFELGQSNLLNLVLREQYAIEAAEAEVDALLEYFIGQAIYNATLARDWPQ